ncbi:hypothetical protein BV22DRAFT_380641 [Leucogyrophana mollusca]|uniref:Uncharacterized protein n=1 Tax=Leucogyrophana mollusca TaxID=85980 RepID=A0ACB8BLS2_9AGAM|nr:hypothetical protein BV22DRAFT_380641 [Leucogyrophana mollusca]
MDSPSSSLRTSCAYDTTDSIASLRDQIQHLKEQIALLALQGSIVHKQRCLLQQLRLLQPLVCKEKLRASALHQLDTAQGTIPFPEDSAFESCTSRSIDAVDSHSLQLQLHDAALHTGEPADQCCPPTSGCTSATLSVDSKSTAPASPKSSLSFSSGGSGFPEKQRGQGREGGQRPRSAIDILTHLRRSLSTSNRRSQLL